MYTLTFFFVSYFISCYEREEKEIKINLNRPHKGTNKVNFLKFSCLFGNHDIGTKYPAILVVKILVELNSVGEPVGHTKWIIPSQPDFSPYTRVKT